MATSWIGYYELTMALAVGLLVWAAANKTKKKDKKLRRRLSFASATLADDRMWTSLFDMKQQTVSCGLFFEDGDVPSRREMKEVGRLLMHKYMHFRAYPDIEPGTKETYTWVDVPDLEAALDKIVVQEKLDKDVIEQQHIQDVKCEAITNKIGKTRVPLWRINIFGNCVLIRLDHVIGDGLTLVSTLQYVATVSKGGRHLRLEELSPIFKLVMKAGSWGLFLEKLSMLWPPKLFRCLKMVMALTSAPLDKPTPLTPFGQDPKAPREIPPEHFAAVYYTPLPLSLYRDLAKAFTHKNVTVNDIAVALLSDSLCRYFDAVGFQREPDHTSIGLTFPLGNPIDPSDFGDEYKGLANRMAPYSFALSLEPLSTKARVLDVHEKLDAIKKSRFSVFMGLMMSLFSYFVTDRMSMVDQMKESFGKSTFVLSNVPGPIRPIYIAGHCVQELHTFVSNPFPMYQIVSYNGVMYLTGQVDDRTTKNTALLVKCFNDSVETFIKDLIKSQSKQSGALNVLADAMGRFHCIGPYVASNQ